MKGTDYEVEKKQKGNKVDVVITFKGNYTGTITKTYTVNSVSAGDTTHTGLLAMITLLSASCIVFLTEKKRRKEF